jgi:transcriptional regulatory protein RtcR
MSPAKERVVIGLVGNVLDSGQGPGRWERWRPTVALCQHEDLAVNRFELLYEKKFTRLAEVAMADIAAVSPETQVHLHEISLDDPWDFEGVFSALHDYARQYPFDSDRYEYLLHITTGSHVCQICMFLLTEAHYFPAKLIQTSPPPRKGTGEPGTYRIIDLDLSRYDRIAQRFHREQVEGAAFLKAGIETRNASFNRMIEHIEHVAVHSQAPILLTGPTGAGKSKLARRIFELKKYRRQITGGFVEVNCATIRGDAAMSALFGHKRGAFTGAVADRPGLLRAADGGLLLLDEIGELGLDEQAMLLRALEEKRFLPVGSDKEVASDFQLIAGTNRDLSQCVREGTFREDLLARINLWTFKLPALAERPEDIEPNLRYELEQSAARTGSNVTFNKEAWERFIKFAVSSEAVWRGNFRDLNAAVTRMATLAAGGRITVAVVESEIERLRAAWSSEAEGDGDQPLAEILSAEALAQLDHFDRTQLAEVVRVCRQSASLADAGRRLFAVSRTKRKSQNDADRVRKYLHRFGVTWDSLGS